MGSPAASTARWLVAVDAADWRIPCVIPVCGNDDSEWTHEPLTLNIPTNAAVHTVSNDLKQVNPAKGLAGSTGTG